MKQTNQEQIEIAKAKIEVLKEKRGGSVLSFHKKIANDPLLLQAFSAHYDICNKELKHIPRKYRELIITAIGCARNASTTIETHAKLAFEHGATVEEMGEVLRLVFLLTGATGLISGAEIFEELDL